MSDEPCEHDTAPQHCWRCLTAKLTRALTALREAATALEYSAQDDSNFGLNAQEAAVAARRTLTELGEKP